MKLAFTTLGCPNWDLDTIISYANKYGYKGVDFRGYLGEMDIYKRPEFSTNVNQTKALFQAASLEISCFSSSVRLYTTSSEQLAEFLDELKQYGELCNHFETPFIRVFGGPIGEASRSEALTVVKENLLEMLKIAEEYQITLLLETHDDWTNCEYVQDVLQLTNSPYLDVLWDVHHPIRTVGESPEHTWKILGSHIKYTHWKDSYVKRGTPRGYQLCLLGEGDIPLREIYQLLEENGYSGYYTLEWEKLWCPEIEEPEVAIPQYAEYMNSLIVNK